MAGKNWEFEYHPVGGDKMFTPKGAPKPGSRVRLTDLGGTVRRSAHYAHISDMEGNPLGLVLKRSLMRISQRAGGNAQPEATDRTLGIFSDRRAGA